MPNFLSLPRELRDDIYRRILSGPLQTGTSRPSLRSRKRVSKQTSKDVATDPASDSSIPPAATSNSPIPPAATSDSSPNEPSSSITNTTPGAGYYDGEETVRYPLATPLPPMNSLLHTSRQIRAELLETLSLTRLHYKMDLGFRNDTDILYPTWISVPAFSHRVDVLDVNLRIRRGKTSSLCSVQADDDELEPEGDIFSGGLMLLQRFLDRGVYFLSKKKAQKITVGLLAIHILPPKDYDYNLKDSNELLKDVGQFLDEWFRGDTHEDSSPQERERQDELMRFFAERIDRLSCQIEDARREWDVKAVIAERERLRQKQKQEQLREGEQGV
jgi:hypothetical protein